MVKGFSNKTGNIVFCIFVFIKNAIIINIRIYEVRFNDYILWVVTSIIFNLKSKEGKELFMNI